MTALLSLRSSHDELASQGSSESSLIGARIAAGVRNENTLTDDVFFARHPEMGRTPIAERQRQLAIEWLGIRDRLVRPALAGPGAPTSSPPRPSPASTPAADPALALGTLACDLPGRRPFRYRFTTDDLLTTARFLVGEAGGRDNAENRGTLWAMLNRYAFFRDLVPGWGSFAGFLKQYSQTLQPYIRHWASVKDFVAKCNGACDNPGCPFQPTRSETYPGTTVRMGQLKSFLKLQATPWERLPATARRLAAETLQGRIPNPVGNATEVADTKVYFRRENGRNPTRAEWEQYTRRFAQKKKWDWRPVQVPYDQFGANALFVTTKARAFPEGATRILPPAAGGPLPSPTAPGRGPISSAPTSSGTSSPPTPTGTYDGKTPAPGTTEPRRSFPTNPPVRSTPGQRSPQLYDTVINQFAAGHNPRYAHTDGKTFCNIFAWDVTRAMNAEVPHWIDAAGNPTLLKGEELNANAVNEWLNRHGARFGWRKVTLAEAVDRANQGCPVVASWNHHGGIGHIAVIRPGIATAAEGPWMAQAGATNANYIRMYKVWKKSADVETWVHA